MVLNSEFWDALTGNQRRKFAKANCEATYAKAIQYQILAALLGVLIVGLFLPIGNKASRYWKGYYSLREEEMPVSVKILCGMNFVLGLFASIVLAFTATGDDYGMFVNTMSRRRLEAMLNETDQYAAAATVGNDDPFRISNFSSVEKAREPKPARKGCENMPAGLLVVIDIAIIAVVIIIMALIFSSCSGKKDKDTTESTASVTSSEAVVESKGPTKDDFGQLDVYPKEIGEGVPMRVSSSSGLKLRKGPTTDSDSNIITKMPDKSKLTVYNYSDYDKWYFVAFESEGKTVYGWACAQSGDDHYIISDSTAPEDQTSSAAASSSDEKVLSSSELKKLAVNHIKAVNDAANDFVSYVQCDNTDVDNSVLFGDDSVGDRYYKVTNAKSYSDIKSYLSKYMITSLVNKQSEIPTVTSTESVPESPVVSYNGALYISGTSSVKSNVDMSTMSVLSSSANAYIITVTSIDDKNDETKYTINFQYIDEKLMVTSYSSK